jgi:hypothetical protein
LVWLFWVIILWFNGKAAWYSKFRYSLQYDVPYSKVTKPNEPRGCDWLRSPIGDKACHYELQVHTVRSAVDAHGNAIISYDEGATWTRCIWNGSDVCAALTDGNEQPEEPARPAVVRSVTLTWEKIDDE